MLPLCSFGVGQRPPSSPREQDSRDRHENGKGRSATSQDGPCAVTQRVEGGHVFYLGKSGVEY